MSALETVRHLYASLAAGRPGEARSVLHDQVEWIQCPGFPGGSHRSGADAVVRDVFGALSREWDDFGTSVSEWLEAGDSVVALGEYRGTHPRTGKPMRSVFAHVYDVRGGLITRFRQYSDTAMMVAAASE